MNTIRRIARAELNVLFYSPIAWLLLILFLIQTSMGYLSRLEYFIPIQEIGNPLSTLTFKIFADRQSQGIFRTGVLSNLYLYIPLITMGLISRETHSGTIRLLYSSPVSLRSIVLGKFLAMLIFNLCMIVMLCIVVVFAIFHIENIDLAIVVSGLFGIFLLLSTYAAIGIFMSCLSSYQVVAAIATFAVFALMSYFGTLWQEYDIIRDIMTNLSIGARTEQMLEGLITTRDTLYYMLITTMFLVFTYLKLYKTRNTVSWLRTMANYSSVVIIIIIIGYFSSKPGYIGYWDVTHNLQNTISVNAQQTLKEIGEEPLEINTYVNLLDDTYYRQAPQSRNSDKKRWELYTRFKPNMKFNYIYYYDSIPKKQLYAMNRGMTLDEMAQKYTKARKISIDKFKKPAEIREMIDLVPENNRLVMQVNFRGKSTFLRTFNDMLFWPSEVEIAAALKRLTIPLPRIAFLKGHEERSIDKLGDRHYKFATSEPNIRASLLNQGFDFETISLSGTEEIPEGLHALVIADPKTALEPEVLAKIKRYIDDGNNLLLAGEPGKQEVLNPILQQLGVQLMDGTLVQEDINFSPDKVASFITPLGVSFGYKISNLQLSKTPVSTKGVAGLTYMDNSSFKIEPLLITDPQKSWNKRAKLVLDSADVVYNPEAGDEKKAHPTALALTRKINNKEQRILVSGDADFLSNVELSRNYPPSANAVFFQGFLGWFSYGEFPIEPIRPTPLDNRIKISGETLPLIKWIMLGIIPAILVATGTVILLRRSRQ